LSRSGSRPLSLRRLYRRLLASYGPQGWWPARTPFEMMAGAIITQNTAWTSVEKAVRALRAARALTPRGLLGLPRGQLEAAVRPAGYFRQKSRRLRILARWYRDGCDSRVPPASVPTAALRASLLELEGVGPETADSILLYAFGRPVFVVDAYTRRILHRLGHLPREKADYGDVQAFFHRALPPDAPIFNEYHALLVRHAKERCRKSAPACIPCPLQGGCRARRTGPKDATREER
jgi:endonuclease-3 related protein